jgi:hypothetical protein
LDHQLNRLTKTRQMPHPARITPLAAGPRGPAARALPRLLAQTNLQLANIGLARRR